MEGHRPNFFLAELLKFGNCAQHFIVYERQKFPSMIYKDLRESYSLLQERTQYFTRGDQCFGHLSVVGYLPVRDPPESG